MLYGCCLACIDVQPFVTVCLRLCFYLMVQTSFRLDFVAETRFVKPSCRIKRNTQNFFCTGELICSFIYPPPFLSKGKSCLDTFDVVLAIVLQSLNNGQKSSRDH